MLLLLQKAEGSLCKDCRANGHSAFVNIKFGMMEQELLMSFLLCPQCEHRAGGMLQKRAEILGTKSLFNFRYIFHAQQIVPCLFNYICYRLIIDHWRTTDLEFEIILSTQRLRDFNGALDLCMDLLMDLLACVT